MVKDDYLNEDYASNNIQLTHTNKQEQSNFKIVQNAFVDQHQLMFTIIRGQNAVLVPRNIYQK